MQQPHVLPLRTLRLLRHQGVVGLPEDHRRVQILAIHVTREGPRLPDQPVDHVPIVDPMFRLTTQPLHRLHQRARVPHLDHLGTDPYLQPLAAQPRRHRVGILLHLDRAALAYLHPLTLQRLQPTLRQRTQPRLLLRKLLPPARVPTGHQRTHQLPVFLSAGEVPAATQQQLLLQRLFETAMALLAVTVLMPAVRIGGLGRHAVMTHQSLIARRVLLGVAIVVNRQRHAVGAMTLRHGTQFPDGVLPPLAQAGETLREAHRHVLPIRVGQHEVVQQVREGLSLDGHAQFVHVRKVRRAQPARFMHLTEKHFLGWAVLGFPLPHPAFDGATLPLPVLARMFPLQPVHQRLGLQGRLTLQQGHKGRPDFAERIQARPPGMRRLCFAGQLAQVAILACCLRIHARFHRRPEQRCSLVEVPPNLLDLRICHLASSSHWQLLLQ